MKTLLFASATALSLTFAGAALAQTTQAEPLSTPPPVQTPSTTPNATVKDQTGATAQAAPPQDQSDATLSGGPEAQATPTPPHAVAPPQANVDAQAGAQTQATVPPAEAADNAEAMAASPAAPATDATSDAAATTSDTASAMCQPRVTSVHFGRGSALSQQNRDAIEYAVDAASVCTLHSVEIADSAEGRLSARRAEAVRATLVRQGVPRERITVASAANAEGASTGQLDVRMNFAGVAAPGAPSATNEAEPTPTPPAS